MRRFGLRRAGRDPRPPTRFARIPAIAVLPDERVEYEVHAAAREGSVADPRREAIVRTLGDWPLEEDEHLGRPETFDGTVGRGAEGWVVILAWAGSGIVGNMAWGLVRQIARRMREVIAQATESDAGIRVSAGAAGYLAIGYVSDEFADEGPLDIQAIEEPSTMGGRSSIDSNYSGFEPWIVALVNAARTHRYVLVVTPAGQVVAANRLNLSVGEVVDPGYVEIEGGTANERRAARERAANAEL